MNPIDEKEPASGFGPVPPAAAVLAALPSPIPRRSRVRERLIGLAALCAATALWLPCVHWVFARSPATFIHPTDVPPHARALAARQLQLWTVPALKQGELQRMRRSNAEWDFMGRSFFVWSLAEMCLREPAAAPRYLAVMDEIIDETLRLEREHGMTVFLMPYANARPYVVRPARSLFVDGEIALMLATRCVARDRPDYRALLTTRVNDIVGRLQASPLHVVESYPDECWMFDHAIALAAVRVTDFLDRTDAHAAFLRDWLTEARRRWTDQKTGLLVSSFSTAGDIGDGPEGSTVWVTLHFLRLLDEDFARAQYALARREFRRGLGGFAWSREWPESWRGKNDIDSGMVIPGLDISAGGSGLAFVGASSFGDIDYLTRLHATLDFAAFPLRENGRLRYCASNLVGDAALLYAGVLGPIWNQVNPTPSSR